MVKTEFAYFAGDPCAAPAEVLLSDLQDELLCFGIDSRTSGLALLLEGPVPTRDVSAPGDQCGWLDDHQAVEKLLLLHTDAGE